MEDKKSKPKTNPKIEGIIADFPKQLKAHPRGTFEEQLRNLLVKHKVT